MPEEIEATTHERPSPTPSSIEAGNPKLGLKTKWSVPDLLRIPDSENAWIIQGLLKRGSQMLLAAPPKSGKSLLASELALALSLPFRPSEIRYLFGASPHAETKCQGSVKTSQVGSIQNRPL